MLDLTGDVPEVAEYVETGRLYLDGTAVIGRWTEWSATASGWR